MPTVNCGSCGVRVKVPESKIGGRDKCPSCAKDLFPESPPPSKDDCQPGPTFVKQIAGENVNPKVHAATDGSAAHLAKIEKLLEKLVDHYERDQRPKVYKVLIIDNNFLTAQFTPAKIETVLNDHARIGWAVKGMVEFNPPSFTGDARAIIVVMERHRDSQPVPSSKSSPLRSEEEDEDAALEALLFSDETTKPEPEGLR